MFSNPRKPSLLSSGGRPPLYEESSSSRTINRPPDYEDISLPRRRPNNELDARETLRVAIEEYNRKKGWRDPDIPEYYLGMFNFPERVKPHDGLRARYKKKKEQEEWKEFWDGVEGWIKYLTEYNKVGDGEIMRQHLLRRTILSPAKLPKWYKY
jgi:hypothetical protein